MALSDLLARLALFRSRGNMPTYVDHAVARWTTEQPPKTGEDAGVECPSCGESMVLSPGGRRCPDCGHSEIRG